MLAGPLAVGARRAVCGVRRHALAEVGVGRLDVGEDVLRAVRVVERLGVEARSAG